ncbi:cyclase [Tateyamaria omphalii]|uniref:cyclase family protein n=1 Tax=Tateyamaria omphalii TaxID=299262 RepID=UPI0016774A15|nr:cyclase family protein [Tateyamaria omphalii]GGX38056.1 cyclase [Tateyamaria omphalii]
MTFGEKVTTIDLTAPLSEATPVIRLPDAFNQAWPFSRQLISKYDAKGEAYWYNISLSEHTGTHIDAPIHWKSGETGSDVASIPLEHLIAPAVVLDTSAEVAQSPDFLLTIEHVMSWCDANGPLPDGGWLLYRTGWDERDQDSDSFLNNGHTPGIEADCAKWLACDTGLIGIGVETVGTDAGKAAGQTPPFPVHWYFLGAGKYGITQLKNLSRLPATGFQIVVAPLPIVGGTGSPCRVFARLPDVRGDTHEGGAPKP